MEKVIEINNLTKSYGKLVALNDFNLDVYKGEILGLLGPNGSGKSTCINTILSLLKFDQGSIKLFGKEMSPSAYDIKSKIGIVFQDVAVFEELNVYDNINYFCGLYIKDKNLRKQYVAEAIELTGLEEFKKFKPKQLSGGLLRRLNIACGVAHKPELIFLDEPTVAVDPQSRNSILEGIKLLNQNGATIVYTTHYMEEVEHLCNRIVIMDKGKIIASGSNDELKELIDLKEIITVKVEDKDNDKIIEFLNNNDNVLNVKQENNFICVHYKDNENNIGQLIDYLKTHNINYSSIYTERPSLNDVFLDLTGKGLRD